MKIKTITQTIIYADEGKILTDGKGNYGSYMRIAEGCSAEDYSEISLEEYEAITAAKEQERGEEM